MFLILAGATVAVAKGNSTGVSINIGQIGVNYVDPGNDGGECTALDHIHYLSWHYYTEQEDAACDVLEKCSWTTAGGSFVTAFISGARKLSLAGAGISLFCTGVYKTVCPPPVLLGKTREYDLWEGYLDSQGVCRARLYGSGTECVAVADPNFCD